MMVDTLTIARELRAADMPAGQAEAIATAIGKSIADIAVTRSDLDLAVQDLKAGTVAVKQDLDILRHELRTNIERVRNQIMPWFFSSQIALGGLMIALIKL